MIEIIDEYAIEICLFKSVLSCSAPESTGPQDLKVIWSPSLMILKTN